MPTTALHCLPSSVHGRGHHHDAIVGRYCKNQVEYVVFFLQVQILGIQIPCFLQNVQTSQLTMYDYKPQSLLQVHMPCHKMNAKGVHSFYGHAETNIPSQTHPRVFHNLFVMHRAFIGDNEFRAWLLSLKNCIRTLACCVCLQGTARQRVFHAWVVHKSRVGIDLRPIFVTDVRAWCIMPSQSSPCCSLRGQFRRPRDDFVSGNNVAARLLHPPQYRLPVPFSMLPYWLTPAGRP